ncbi:hypothetical protein L245_28035, partial [Salmonella enterica subsp. enterica serovar Worthington str. BCH-4719]
KENHSGMAVRFFMVMCAIILRRNSKTKGRGDSVIN